uniref:Uncharacterized protein n=1 Tax=Cannabis sativa TaxID=3483 RepID=A0A803QUB1_CANSA
MACGAVLLSESVPIHRFSYEKPKPPFLKLHLPMVFICIFRAKVISFFLFFRVSSAAAVVVCSILLSTLNRRYQIPKNGFL